MSDVQIEEAIKAQGLTAPRITPADIEANIASEHYFTAADGLLSEGGTGVQHIEGIDNFKALGLLTFCVFVLRNGTKIVGINYGAIDPAQHDSERSRKDAREDAIRQVWPLMGYELRTKLAGAHKNHVTDEMVSRFLQWPVPASVYPDGTPGVPGRTGTNLMGAVEARQMLESVLSNT